jgi:hypothetical protein
VSPAGVASEEGDGTVAVPGSLTVPGWVVVAGCVTVAGCSSAAGVAVVGAVPLPTDGAAVVSPVAGAPATAGTLPFVVVVTGVAGACAGGAGLAASGVTTAGSAGDA